MTAPPPIQVIAIACQLRQIAAYAQKYDSERLFVRGLLRDALNEIERPDRRLPPLNKAEARS